MSGCPIYLSVEEAGALYTSRKVWGSKRESAVREVDNPGGANYSL